MPGAERCPERSDAHSCCPGLVHPPHRASPCLQPGWLLRASLAPASVWQRSARGGCSGAGSAGTGRDGQALLPKPGHPSPGEPGVQRPPANSQAPTSPWLAPHGPKRRCPRMLPLLRRCRAEPRSPSPVPPPPRASGSARPPDSQVLLLFTVFTDRL